MNPPKSAAPLCCATPPISPRLLTALAFALATVPPLASSKSATMV
jgi:hypothetical protein